MNADPQAGPWMPRIQQLPKLGIVGVLKPCCTTRFTRTRHSDIVHPVSSSQLTETRYRVRSFGGYNSGRAPKTPTLLDVLWVRGRLKLQNQERSLPRVLDSNLRVTASPTRVSLGVASCQSEILSLKK